MSMRRRVPGLSIGEAVPLALDRVESVEIPSAGEAHYLRIDGGSEHEFAEVVYIPSPVDADLDLSLLDDVTLVDAQGTELAKGAKTKFCYPVGGGATRCIQGSHRVLHRFEVPADTTYYIKIERNSDRPRSGGIYVIARAIDAVYRDLVERCEAAARPAAWGDPLSGLPVASAQHGAARRPQP